MFIGFLYEINSSSGSPEEAGYFLFYRQSSPRNCLLKINFVFLRFLHVQVCFYEISVVRDYVTTFVLDSVIRLSRHGCVSPGVRLLQMTYPICP